jgi:hypothetical protein
MLRSINSGRTELAERLVCAFLQILPQNGYIGLYIRSRESVVGAATGYGLGDRGVGVRVPAWSRMFSFPRRSDRFLGPPNLLSNGYQGSFPGGKAVGA